MAINTLYTPVKLSGDGSTPTFSFPWKIFSTSDILVKLINKTTLAETTQVLGTNYSVAISTTAEGGVVTFLTGSIPASTVWVFMESAIPETQPTSFPLGAPLREDNIEKMGDRAIRIIQQLSEVLDRCLKLSALDALTVSTTLPSPDALMYLRWNAAETALENATPVVTTTDYPSAFTCGAFADLPAVPTAGDIYVSLDTATTYICYTAGVWSILGGDGKSITQVTHGFAVGDVLRHNGTNYVKAQADSEANAQVVGIVSGVTDTDTFTLLDAGFVSGLSGLTAGVTYYLSPSSAGALTSTKPSIVGQVVKPLLRATATTAGFFFNQLSTVVVAATPPYPCEIVTDATKYAVVGGWAYDDSIPQISEGTNYTQLTITHSLSVAGRSVIVEAAVNTFHGIDVYAAIALFTDGSVNAIATGQHSHGQTGGEVNMVHAIAKFTPANTDPVVYTVRLSGTGGTAGFNGSEAGARHYGGVHNSYLKITEID